MEPSRALAWFAWGGGRGWQLQGGERRENKGGDKRRENLDRKSRDEISFHGPLASSRRDPPPGRKPTKSLRREWNWTIPKV